MLTSINSYLMGRILMTMSFIFTDQRFSNEPNIGRFMLVNKRLKEPILVRSYIDLSTIPLITNFSLAYVYFRETSHLGFSSSRGDKRSFIGNLFLR